MFPQETDAETLSITILADENRHEIQTAPGQSVSKLIQDLSLTLGPDDYTDPGMDEIMTRSGTIRVIRVFIEENTEESLIPFESQTVRSETLPDGEMYLIQAGKNGRQQTTTRTTYEDGVQVKKQISRIDVLEEALPEILMLGAKAEYAPIHIPGKLIYISNGSAWMMSGSTENRTPLITSGDLDGRILDLSSNGKWLLFSRSGNGEELNTLWMKNIEDWEAAPISLRVSNVLRFASWLPGNALRFIYSTVDTSEDAPGWKANNDLWMQTVSDSGMIMAKEQVLQQDHDSSYSWWGRDFILSKDGRSLLYAAPDEIGTIDRLTAEEKPLIHILPYEQTRSDWAWVPGISWNADETGLVFSYHGSLSGSGTSYKADDYHLGKYDLSSGKTETAARSTGIFSYPSASIRFSDGSAYIAYLQTLTPQQSESERYRIMLMDENGEDIHAVYPIEGGSGYITPQKVIWSPTETAESSWVSFLSDGNLWMVNPFNGIYNQITSDNSITTFIWE